MKQNTMHLLRTLPRLTFFAIFISLVAVGTSCKSKKKAMEVTDKDAVERARLEKEAALKKQQEEEARIKRDADEKARLAAEEDKKRAPYAKLEQYFASISGASSADAANNSINEALSLFSSPDVPVLIVIHEEAGQKDYDRPTTIREYLNYLKDQKKKADKIGTLKFDAAGKINEVELIK
ncbi:MAG: nucleoid-structuring protein H-NS [Chryseolinea sp.]